MSTYPSKDGYLKERALTCARFWMEYSVHFRASMQETLSRTSFFLDPLFEGMVRMSAQKCRPPEEPSRDFSESQIRHCDVDGRITHVNFATHTHKFPVPVAAVNACVRECAKEYELDLHSTSYLSLLLVRVTRGEGVVIPKNVIPIVAGYLADGRRVFLPIYSRGLVTESNSIERNCMDEEDGQSSQSDSYSRAPVGIFCLRYAPDTYPRLFGPDDFMCGEGAGIDATGPYSWRFTRDLPRIEAKETDEHSEAEGPDE